MWMDLHQLEGLVGQALDKIDPTQNTEMYPLLIKIPREILQQLQILRSGKHELM